MGYPPSPLSIGIIGLARASQIAHMPTTLARFFRACRHEPQRDGTVESHVSQRTRNMGHPFFEEWDGRGGPHGFLPPQKKPSRALLGMDGRGRPSPHNLFLFFLFFSSSSSSSSSSSFP